jgi:hypothetical protein
VSDAGFSKLHALSAIRDDRTLSKAERLVLVMLISHASKTGECFPSIDLLADETAMARCVVADALTSLRSRGAASPVSLAVEHRASAKGRGRVSNLYRLHLSPPGRLKSARSKSAEQTQVPKDLSLEIERPKSGKGPDLSLADRLEAGHEAGHEAGKGSAATSVAGSFALEAPTPRAKKKPSKPAPNGGDHQAVTKCYFDEWQAKHEGAAPVFRAREGKAVSDLLAALNGNVAEACTRIRNCFASWNWKGKTILTIAGSPDAFAVVAPPFAGPRGAGPRQPNCGVFDASLYE